MNKYLKWALFGLAVILGIIFYPKLSAIANVDALRTTIEPYGVLAPVLFGIIYIISGLLFLPLSVFSVAGGILFGTLNGLIIVLIAATIAGALAFLISRQFSNYIPEAKAGLIHKLQNTVEKRLEKNTFQAIAILRLLYLPYIGLSYAAGLVKTAQFWPYVWATFLTNIAGSFVFVYLGDQLDKGLTALIIPVVLIALTLLVPKIVKQFVNQKGY